MRDRQAYLTLGANVIAKRNVVSCVACLDSRDAQRLGGKFPPKGRDFFLNMNGPGGGKVRGAGAQQPPVDLVALEVHRGASPVFDPNLDARRFGEVIENLRGLALGKLGAVEIDADRNAAIGGARSACMIGQSVRTYAAMSISCSARSIKSTSICSRFSVGA
jgi:hypothetical protein